MARAHWGLRAACADPPAPALGLLDMHDHSRHTVYDKTLVGTPNAPGFTASCAALDAHDTGSEIASAGSAAIRSTPGVRLGAAATRARTAT